MLEFRDNWLVFREYKNRIDEYNYKINVHRPKCNAQATGLLVTSA